MLIYVLKTCVIGNFMMSKLGCYLKFKLCIMKKIFNFISFSFTFIASVGLGSLHCFVCLFMCFVKFLQENSTSLKAIFFILRKWEYRMIACYIFKILNELHKMIQWFAVLGTISNLCEYAKATNNECYVLFISS